MRTGRPHRAIPDDVLARAYCDTGRTLSELAAELGCSAANLKQRAGRIGLPGRAELRRIARARLVEQCVGGEL